jgi:hypothetical protein
MSSPKTWIPSGLRTPVDSISVRVWIGIHQMFGMPGYDSFSSISATRRSQVMPSRHSERGFRTTVVSTIPIGAGSVGVSARPILPNTLATSGNLRSSRSMSVRTFDASAIDMPGGAVGM